jgi:ribosomal protein S18 acetylase RimI-like enzyme
VTARVGGVVAGWVEGWRRPGEAHAASLVVDPDQAYLGVGGHLIAAFRAEAADRGCDTITLAPAIVAALAMS